MSKIKSAEDWIKEMQSRGINMLSEEVKAKMGKLLKDVQEQCRQATLEVAADNGKVYLSILAMLNGKKNVPVAAINKQSILSLSDSPLLKID